jgi:hypothetical protein
MQPTGNRAESLRDREHHFDPQAQRAGAGNAAHDCSRIADTDQARVRRVVERGHRDAKAHALQRPQRAKRCRIEHTVRRAQNEHIVGASGDGTRCRRDGVLVVIAVDQRSHAGSVLHEEADPFV